MKKAADWANMGMYLTGVLSLLALVWQRGQAHAFFAVRYLSYCPHYGRPDGEYRSVGWVDYASGVGFKTYQSAMKHKTSTLILSALAVPLIAWLGGKWLVARQILRDVADLFSLVDTGPVNTYDPAQLTGLPAPVQRYFRHVLKSGQPYVRTVRLRHDGEFKTDLKKDWMPITGEEFFRADTPDYIWIGTTTWFTARDQYVAGRGSLTVRLLGTLPIVNGTGPSFDQGELLRWLAETAWFPTSLLPGSRVVWSPNRQPFGHACDHRQRPDRIVPN